MLSKLSCEVKWRDGVYFISCPELLAFLLCA
jgi:hypothetical protein